MRLIDVNAVLALENSIERDQATYTPAEVLVERYGSRLAETEYAILSHCWGLIEEGEREVLFSEMKQLATMSKDDLLRSGLRSYSGYKKIIDTCRQAHVDKLEWVWVDTCCINKESSSELSEAINSMYQWYANSRLCYAYIHDIDDFTLPTDKDERRFEAFNGWPKWFSRGWTLQELVAPKKILFFNRKWEFIGDKQSLASAIGGITRIPYPILVYGLSSNRPCVAGIMSWSADRRTTREEDRAYSLLGLFGVHMPMLYGEGKNAFKRLQLEIIRTSNDQSIFAWDPRGHLRRTGSVLADDPSLFRDCSKITKLETDEFIKYCEGEPHAAERIGTFPVTNRGIQIWMPLQRYRGSRSVFKAKLACLGEFGIPVTIDVAYWRSNYYRYSNASHMDVGSSHTELRCVYLTYQDDAYYPDFTFKLDDRVLAFCGFTRYGTHPRDHGYDPLILSSTNPLSVITYANGNTGIRFALGLGYCFGQEWAHVNVLCSGLGSPEETPRIALANDPRNIYDKMWNAAPDHARRWAEENQQTPGGVNAKHAHIQASTSTVRLIYAKRTSRHEGIIMLDVAQCIGCCLGLLKWMQLRGRFTRDHPDMPSLMVDVPSKPGYEQQLYVNGISMEFSLAHPGIKLGDYGHHDHGGIVKVEGNVFQDIKSMGGVDLTSTLFSPVEFKITDKDSGIRRDSVTTLSGIRWAPALILHDPTGCAIPNNQSFASVLKSLSTHLQNKWLVTRIIQCSSCNISDAFKETANNPQIAEYTAALNHSHTSDSCSSTNPHIITPLCTFSWPIVCAQDKPSMETLKAFRKIRGHFWSLMGIPTDKFAELDNPQTSVHNHKETDAAIEFFEDMFGTMYFKDYVGKITFFMQLRMVTSGTNSQRKFPGSNAEGWFSRFSKSSPKTIPSSSIDFLASTLLKWISTSPLHDDWSHVKAKIHHDAVSISTSLGAEILEDICAIYCQKSSELKDITHDDNSLPLMVQHLITLQEKLYTATETYEQQALEVDLTGRILWTCWQGIRAEALTRLVKVVDQILRDSTISHDLVTIRARSLRGIGNIFYDAHCEDSPYEDRSYLRQIMAEARAGTSKYQLFLAEQAADEGGGLNTRRNFIGNITRDILE